MVALRLHKYADEIPQIGKIIGMTDLDVTVEWWVGSYSDTWMQWKERGSVITETIPRNAVLYSPVAFTKSLRLSSKTVEELKCAYNKKELI